MVSQEMKILSLKEIISWNVSVDVTMD